MNSVGFLFITLGYGWKAPELPLREEVRAMFGMDLPKATLGGLL